MFWSKLCKSNWKCAWNLAFPVFISPVVWNICENLHYESVYFKELHNEQENYWPTIYRAGAAVASTITSYAIGSIIVVMAEICRRVTLYTLNRISSLLLHGRYIQLFRERLSEKVHSTIPKGIVGGFEFTVDPFVCKKLRLRVVPHFSSRIVEGAKRERAWKSPHARKGDTPVYKKLGHFIFLVLEKRESRVLNIATI